MSNPQPDTPNEVQPPAWGGNKAVFLNRLIVATECRFNREVAVLLDRILNAISTKQPNGSKQVEALHMQAVALYCQTEAATALLSDDEFARMLAEHDRQYPLPAADEPLTPGGGGNPTAQQLDDARFIELIAFAEGEGTRHGDHVLAAELRRLEGEGLLSGEARLFAARFIVEAAARIDEYANADRFIAGLRN